MDPIKASVVSAKDIGTDKNSIVMNRGDDEASVGNIPNLDILTGHIFEILQYLERPDVKKIMKKNDTAIKMQLNNKYADTVPLGIITVLMEEDSREENVARLLNMFEGLNRAKRGEESLEEVGAKFTEEVNQRYVYSKYGSKEAFEKELQKELAKEQRKKSKIKNVH